MVKRLEGGALLVATPSKDAKEVSVIGIWVRPKLFAVVRGRSWSRALFESSGAVPFLSHLEPELEPSPF